MDDIDSILGRMVRVGIVTAVDGSARMARVKFEDDNENSGMLYVLASPPFIPGPDSPQHTGAAEGHEHPLEILPWMPKVNDTVLVLYLPVDDSDGYILGRIGGGG